MVFSGRVSLWVYAALVVAVCGCASDAAAQNVGTLSGTVKDSMGLAVPGAMVSVNNRVSQTHQDTVTDMQGHFQLSNVPFGIYVITAELTGFTNAEKVLDVHSTVPVTVDLMLSVGGLSETVSVAADALAR